MRAWLAVLLVGSACACGPSDLSGRDAQARERGTAVVGGRVVATVDGRPIDRDLVAHATREAGVSPRLALTRLEDEELLAAAAARAGHGDDPAVARAARRAAVQLLLARDVEAEITEADIDRATLDAAYDAAPRERFTRPERRRSAYAFAQVDEAASPAVAAAAEAWIREVHATLARSDDPLRALLAIGRRAPESHPFETRVEEIPPLARTDDADPAYLAALFVDSEPGLIGAPVRSGIGWHAVVVTEIVPAWSATRAEALAMLLDERLAALRARRLEERVRELAGASPVRMDPNGVRFVLEDARLSSGGAQ